MNEEEKKAIEKIKKDLEEEKKLRGDYKWKTGFYENGYIERVLNLVEKQQNKIEDLKKEKRILIEKYTDVVYECVKRNKEIEKQQKEIKARLKEIDSLYKMMSVKDDKIEELKEDYQILKDDIEEHNIVYVDTPEFEENYVSKDKIKEKIKELESHIWKDGYMTKFDRYAIHYLNELLGE